MRNVNRRRISTFAALTLVVLPLLAACVPEQTASPPVNTSGALESATPANDSPQVGTVLDQATASALGRQTKGQLRGYPMPDGTYLVVDRSQPLPQPVQQDISAKGRAYASTYVEDGGGNPNMLTDRTKLIGTVEADTGKKAILVVKLDVFESPDAAERTTTYFVNGRGPQPDGVNRDRDQIATIVADWLAQQPNPDEYVVIWPN